MYHTGRLLQIRIFATGIKPPTLKFSSADSVLAVIQNAPGMVT